MNTREHYEEIRKNVKKVFKKTLKPWDELTEKEKRDIQKDAAYYKKIM